MVIELLEVILIPYESQDNNIWDELFKLQKKYSSKLKLQFVALAPLEFWDTSHGEELAKKFSKEKVF